MRGRLLAGRAAALRAAATLTSASRSAYGGSRLRFVTRTLDNATAGGPADARSRVPLAPAETIWLLPQSLASCAVRPVVGRSKRSSGPGNAPPIHPSSLRVRADAAPDVVAPPDARRAASVSSRERSRIAWPHRAGTPIATSEAQAHASRRPKAGAPGAISVYCAVRAGPLVTKPVAMAACHKLLRWLKKEERSLLLTPILR